MHFLNFSVAKRCIVATGIAALLAACSGGTSVSPATNASGGLGYAPMGADAHVRANLLAASGRSLPPGTPGALNKGWLSAAARAGSHVIYSGSYNNSTITIYPSKGINPAPIGSITTGLTNPERLFVNKNLKLYTTDEGSPTAIVVYNPGATSPSLTITKGVNFPTGITVGAADGTVYCANTGNETVTEYPKGKTAPSLTITLNNLTPENLAVDGSNNLYIQYLGGPLGSGVIKVPPGQTSGTDLNLVIGSASALSVDQAGKIVIIDQGSSSLDVFPPGQTTPSKTIALGGFPFEMSMNKAETEVYVSNDIGTPFEIQIVDYPTLKKVKAKINPTLGDWPLAVSPDNEL
jgi:hypothetical protein